MQIKEIIAEMQKLEISPAMLCSDLGFNKGDLSCYLSEKKTLPNSRLKALEWYFKYKNLHHSLTGQELIFSPIKIEEIGSCNDLWSNPKAPK